MLRITVLIDNAAAQPDLLTEHGLAMWIEFGDKRILWDAGQSDILLANARTLGIDLAAADIIAISHGHYDHTGGLPAVLPVAQKASLYLHPEIFLSRYSKKQSIHPIGMPIASAQSLQARPVHLTESWIRIGHGIFLTGAIPRLNSFEDTGGSFFLDAECSAPDSVPDDQAMVLESGEGLIVILGCAHSGLVNTLDYVCRNTGKNTIHTVIGGMHLLNANRQRMDFSVDALRKYDVQNIVPLHCTGQAACDYLKNALAGKVINLSGKSCLAV